MHAAFLAAIADRPDDDLPRLVYADYLDETGELERAEFIRVQIELANRPPHERRPELVRREAELRRHKAEWVLPEFRGQSQVFRRGFVEEVNVAAEWLIARPDSLLTPGPLRHLRVVGATQFTDRLARLPGLARLETLDLSNTQFGNPAQVRNLFANARLDRLRRLILRNAAFWQDEEISALADTAVAPRLRRLDVSGNRLGDAGVGVLAGRPEFGGLEALAYRADELDYHFCVHATGAEALANSTTLTRLKALDLGDHYVGDAGLRSLATGPNADRLERLGVEYNEMEIGDSGILAVVESPRLTNLRELRFGGNELGPLGVEALAAWPHLERMEVVSLEECPLTDAVRGILRRSRWADKFVF